MREQPHLQPDPELLLQGLLKTYVYKFFEVQHAQKSGEHFTFVFSANAPEKIPMILARAVLLGDCGSGHVRPKTHTVAEGIPLLLGSRAV
jgi:hypothetical protein